MTLPSSKHFTNREEVLRAYDGLWNDSSTQRILNIEGMSGNGKSTVLWYIVNHYDGEKSKNRRHLILNLEQGILLSDEYAILDKLKKWLIPILPSNAFTSFNKLRKDLDRVESAILRSTSAINLNLSASRKGKIVESPTTIDVAIKQRIAQHRNNGRTQLTNSFMECVASLIDHELVLLVDTYEVVSGIEHASFRYWFEEVLVDQLLEAIPSLRIVIAGQENLPFGDERRQQNRLIEWTRPQSDFFLESHGLTDAELQRAIYEHCQGHPLLTNFAYQVWEEGVVTGNLLTPQMLLHHADRQAASRWLVARLLERLKEPLQSAVRVAALLRPLTLPAINALLPDGLALSLREYNHLLGFSFVQHRVNQPYQVHNLIRRTEEVWLREHESPYYQEVHQKAADYYRQLQQHGPESQRDEYWLEQLYHQIRANEQVGIGMFQEKAEQLLNYKWLSRLRTLLNEINAYPLKEPASRLWRQYYSDQLANLERRLQNSSPIWRSYADNPEADDKLRGYALCEWVRVHRGAKFIRQPGGFENLVENIERSNSFLSSGDTKRATNLVYLGEAYQRRGQLDQAFARFREAISLFEARGDEYGVATVYVTMMDTYALGGDWRRLFEVQQEGLKRLPEQFRNSIAYSHLAGVWAAAWVWSGRYQEAVQRARISQEFRLRLGEVDLTGPPRELGFALGMQRRFIEAEQHFNTGNTNHRNVHGFEDTSALCWWAAVLLKQGEYERAQQLLKRSWKIKKDKNNLLLFPENLYYQGQLHELRGEWDKAERCYTVCLDRHRWTGRRYFECGALTGLVRVKYAQRNYEGIEAFLQQAEQLAQQFEYNDQLASLRLIQGHLSFNGTRPNSTKEKASTSADIFYRDALIYALRYNALFLDEVLAGQPPQTSLPSLIPHCLSQGSAGQSMLSLLRQWWHEGTNDIGVHRPNTIARVQEGSSLILCERAARDDEPGNGAESKSVIEQMTDALRTI